MTDRADRGADRVVEHGTGERGERVDRGVHGERRVRAVVFDVGETLVDETRLWAAWADWLGVPALTLFGVLGGVIERGEHHRRAFQILRPGFDHDRESAARAAAGRATSVERRDFYPDAVPCLAALRAEGYRIGLAGNQPVDAEATLRSLGLPVDVVASSAGWGVEKPDPAFFARVADAVGLPPAAIAYVGDRVDNDVVPAAEAGMLAVFLRRGPWGYTHAELPGVARADIRLDTLAALPEALRPFAAAGHGPGGAAAAAPAGDR